MENIFQEKGELWDATSWSHFLHLILGLRPTQAPSSWRPLCSTVDNNTDNKQLLQEVPHPPLSPSFAKASPSAWNPNSKPLYNVPSTMSLDNGLLPLKAISCQHNFLVPQAALRASSTGFQTCLFDHQAVAITSKQNPLHFLGCTHPYGDNNHSFTVLNFKTFFHIWKLLKSGCFANNVHIECVSVFGFCFLLKTCYYIESIS